MVDNPVPRSLFVLCILVTGPVHAFAQDGMVAGSSASLIDAGIEVLPARRVPGEPWKPAPSAFEVRVDTFRIQQTISFVVLQPGQQASIAAPTRPAAMLETTSDRRDGWIYTAGEEPGVEAFRVVDGADTVHVNVFIHRPMTEMVDGVLDGYRIGAYRPRPATRGKEYEPPSGLVPVRPEDEDILLSPHFAVGQFVSKQPGNPSYVALSRPLVLKLEAVLREVRSEGFDVHTLTVMSGFRTPHYNRAIGNTTSFSRHLWGDAADVYVDRDGNGEMDDLNGDGRVNRDDAALLASWVDRLMRKRLPRIRPGGLATYSRNAVRGPFVHVDARGTRARW